jgi:2-haloacid dehalogenase
MSEIKVIIFDLGNVLVEWNPRFVFDENYFDSEEKRNYFFSHICTDGWNEEQDTGRSIVDATMELVKKFPDWEPAIRDYYGRWTEMLRSPIHGSVEILRKLKERGKYKLLALTNWNACLFEIALVRYDFLHWFDGRVVSGMERTRKPFLEFYKILLERYDVNPEEAIFIDDNLRNINAAAELGMFTIHFRNPEQLMEELNKTGIVIF